MTDCTRPARARRPRRGLPPRRGRELFRSATGSSARQNLAGRQITRNIGCHPGVRQEQPSGRGPEGIRSDEPSTVCKTWTGGAPGHGPRASRRPAGPGRASGVPPRCGGRSAGPPSWPRLRKEPVVGRAQDTAGGDAGARESTREADGRLHHRRSDAAGRQRPDSHGAASSDSRGAADSDSDGASGSVRGNCWCLTWAAWIIAGSARAGRLRLDRARQFPWVARVWREGQGRRVRSEAPEEVPPPTPSGSVREDCGFRGRWLATGGWRGGAGQRSRIRSGGQGLWGVGFETTNSLREQSARDPPGHGHRRRGWAGRGRCRGLPGCRTPGGSGQQCGPSRHTAGPARGPGRRPQRPRAASSRSGAGR